MSRKSSGEQSNMSAGDKLTNWINKLSEKPISVGKDRGFFVKSQTMDSLESKLHGLMVSGETSKSPTELIELNRALQEARSRADRAMTELKASNGALTQARNNVEEKDTELQQKTLALKNLKAELGPQFKELHAQLEAEKANGKALRDDLMQGTARFDESVALALSADREANRLRVKELNAALQERSTKQQQLQDEVNAAHATLKSLREEHETLSHRNKEKEGSVAELAIADWKVGETKVAINRPLLKSVLGEKGLEWLVKADQVARADVRDRAFHLMQAFKSAPTKTIKSYGDILEVVFNWIKLHIRKAATRVKPWLDAIENDLRSAKLKTLKVYKEQLELLLEEVVSLKKPRKAKESQETGADKGTSDHSESTYDKWYWTPYFYTHAVINRVSRKVKSAKSLMSKGYQALKKGFNRVLTFWSVSNKVSEEDLLFEAEAEEKLLGVDHSAMDPKPKSGKGKGIDLSRHGPAVGKVKNMASLFRPV